MPTGKAPTGRGVLAHTEKGEHLNNGFKSHDEDYTDDPNDYKPLRSITNAQDAGEQLARREMAKAGIKRGK